jgi:hypothetical protein
MNDQLNEKFLSVIGGIPPAMLSTFPDSLRLAMRGMLNRKNRIRPIDTVCRRIIFNGNVTIVFWNSERKGVAKCDATDVFDPELGFLIAFFKAHSSILSTKARQARLSAVYGDTKIVVLEEAKTTVYASGKDYLRAYFMNITKKDKATLDRILKSVRFLNARANLPLLETIECHTTVQRPLLGVDVSCSTKLLAADDAVQMVPPAQD